MIKKNKKTFYSYYEKEVTALQEILTASIPSTGPKPIHQLRVHIKNIRAFLRLLEETVAGQLKIKKFKKKLKKVFKTAGDLRDMQLNHTLAKYSDKPLRDKTLYKKHCKKNILDKKKDLQKILSKFDPQLIRKANLKVKRICETSSNDILLAQSNKFILKKLKRIQSIQEKRGAEGLHLFRKHLKSICVVAGIACEIRSTSTLKNQLKQLKKIEQSIGKWHDNLMFQMSWLHFKKNSPQIVNNKTTLSQYLFQIKTNRKSIDLLLQQISNNLTHNK